MKVDPRYQTQILDVQRLDTSMTQLRHKRSTLPEIATVTELEAKTKGLRDRVVAATIIADEAAAAVRKSEADVAVVRERKAKELARAEAGNMNAKQSAALERDLAHIERRTAELEDEQLQYMENAEKADAVLAEVQQLLDVAQKSLDEANSALLEARSQIDAELAAAEERRADATDGIPEDFLALYDKIAERHGGVGAAQLVGRRCEGCRITLTEGDMEPIRSAAPDDVLRCEECSRLLVRTEQSSL